MNTQYTFLSAYGYALSIPDAWRVDMGEHHVSFHDPVALGGPPLLVVRAAQARVESGDDLRAELYNACRQLRLPGGSHSESVSVTQGLLSSGGLDGYWTKVTANGAEGNASDFRIIGFPLSQGKTVVLMIHPTHVEAQVEDVVSSFRAADDAVSRGYRRFASDRARFSLEYPETWILRKTSSRVTHFRAPGRLSTFSEAVVSLEEPDALVGLGEIAEVATDALNKQLAGTEVEVSGQTAILGGLEGLEFVYTWSPIEGLLARSRRVICVGPTGTVSSLTITASEGKWAEHATVFEHIIGSVHWWR